MNADGNGRRIDELERENAALRRWIAELRTALDALLSQAGPDFVSQPIPQLRPDR